MDKYFQKYEQERKREFRQKKQDFLSLASEHFDDIFKSCVDIAKNEKIFARIMNEQYMPNTENVFEEHLFCVMVLKASNMFDPQKKHIIKNVKRIGGGFVNDGYSDGITFNLDGKDYEFSNGQKEYSNYEKLPVTKKQLAAVDKLNKCCYNRYDFSNIKTKSDERVQQ